MNKQDLLMKAMTLKNNLKISLEDTENLILDIQEQDFNDKEAVEKLNNNLNLIKYVVHNKSI